MAFSPEQRAKAYSPEAIAKRIATKAAKKAAEGSAPAAPVDAVAGDYIPPVADTLSEFASLAKMLAEAGDNKRRKDEAIDGIESALGKLSTVDMPELVQHPTIQKLLGMVQERRVERGVQPGEIYGEGLSRTKQPWRKEDLTRDKFEYVTVTPGRNEDITWNGITVHAFEGVTMELPRVIWEVSLEARRLNRAAEEHKAMFLATKSQKEMGINNGVPSDPSMLAGIQGQRTRMLRGAFAGGMIEHGAGIVMTVPDADRPGIEDIEEGGE